MRIFKKWISLLAVMAIIIISFSPAYAQGETIQGVELKDGSIIYGKIIKMNTDEIIIQKKDGETFTYKFDDVQTLIKEEQTDSTSTLAKETAEGQPEKKKASIPPVARYTWEIGPELSSIEYEEPNIMKEKGMMYGIGASYTYHQGIMLKADARICYGQVDYQNSGNLDNINDYLIEIRMLGGYDYQLTGSTVLTPFIGLGVRYLRDESNGRTTSTGESGYLRESRYIYSPLGVTVSNDFKNSWVVGLTLEYDIFWQGRQKSHLSDVSSAYSDLENNQNGGYGLRGSLLIKKIFGRMSYSLEPFIIYWKIEQSDIQNITYNGAIWGYGWEPQNNSTEVGVKFKVGF